MEERSIAAALADRYPNLVTPLVPLPRKGFLHTMFDLDKVLEEEEEKPDFEFSFDGDKYTLPGAIDVRAIAAISGGRLDDGLRMLLDPEQWQKIQDSPKRLTITALERLFDDYAKFTGATSLGGSSASTPSS